LEDVEGVYLVGGGTHPGSGLPVIYEGARITTDLVLADLGLQARDFVSGQTTAAAEPSFQYVPPQGG
jgi:phytoene desaturase